jgi:hypothetical protein
VSNVGIIDEKCIGKDSAGSVHYAMEVLKG